MAEPNVIHVQSLYAAFGRGDLDYIVRACAPNASWEVVGRPQDFPTFGVRIGPAGVMEFFSALQAAKTIVEFTPQAFYACNGTVFLEGQEVSIDKKSGFRIDTPWLHAFTFRDGEIIRFREFLDTAQFAEAARS